MNWLVCGIGTRWYCILGVLHPLSASSVAKPISNLFIKRNLILLLAVGCGGNKAELLLHNKICRTDFLTAQKHISSFLLEGSYFYFEFLAVSSQTK